MRAAALAVSPPSSGKIGATPVAAIEQRQLGALCGSSGVAQLESLGASSRLVQSKDESSRHIQPPVPQMQGILRT